MDSASAHPGSTPPAGTKPAPITDITQLDAVKSTSYPDVFMASLENLYQYAMDSIQEHVNKRDVDTLSQLRDLMCAKVVQRFPQYAGRQTVKRRTKAKVVLDVITLGSNIVNKTLSKKDLDNIFRDQTHEIESSVAFGPEKHIADLIQTVAVISSRLTSVEKELSDLKKSPCICSHTGQEAEQAIENANATNVMDIPTQNRWNLLNEDSEDDEEDSTTMTEHHHDRAPP